MDVTGSQPGGTTTTECPLGHGLVLEDVRPLATTMAARLVHVHLAPTPWTGLRSGTRRNTQPSSGPTDSGASTVMADTNSSSASGWTSTSTSKVNMGSTILRPMAHIGFIGLGLMGKPMAKNLLAAGFPLIVHSRRPSPVDELVALGATEAKTPRAVAELATRIITMVPDSPDVERVLEGGDGVFDGLQASTVIIDMSSIAPTATRRLAQAAAERGATMLDAPVSGGEIGAIHGTLSIMVGGARAAFDEVLPILHAMGNPERIIYIGESGAGQVCKLCNQAVLAGTIAAVGEAFALARRNGVDPSRVREALLGGFAQSRVLDVHGERMLQGNYVPGFRTELFAKDLRNVVAAAAESSTPALISGVVLQLVTSLMAQDRGRRDYSDLGKLIFEMAGLEG